MAKIDSQGVLRLGETARIRGVSGASLVLIFLLLIAQRPRETIQSTDGGVATTVKKKVQEIGHESAQKEL